MMKIDKELKKIFEECIKKFSLRNSKPGNSTKPWGVFSTQWLEKRLNDEIKEWQDSRDPDELIDVIVCAAILKLALTVNCDKKPVNNLCPNCGKDYCICDILNKEMI